MLRQGPPQSQRQAESHLEELAHRISLSLALSHAFRPPAHTLKFDSVPNAKRAYTGPPTWSATSCAASLSAAPVSATPPYRLEPPLPECHTDRLSSSAGSR